MELHNLFNIYGKKPARKRRGIGEGSGNGKTSGRGQKGQTSRSGGSIRHGFESGHIPLYRKLPHRGFSNYKFRKSYQVVNLHDLAQLTVTTIDRAVLVEARLVRKNGDPIKVLGDGEIGHAVTITADRFSASAKEKILAAGGQVVELVSSPSSEVAEVAAAN